MIHVTTMPDFPDQYTIRTDLTERNYVYEDEIYATLAHVCWLDWVARKVARTGVSFGNWKPARVGASDEQYSLYGGFNE